MKKKLLLATCALAAFAGFSYAQDSNDATADAGSASPARMRQTFTFEAFYGAATKDALKDNGDFGKINVGGIRATYEPPATRFADADGRCSLSLFVGSELSGGYREKKYYSGGYYNGKDEVSVVHYNVFAGLRGRIALDEKLALTANVRLGLDCAYLGIEESAPGHYHDDDDDSDVGFLLGAGVGLEYGITRHISIIAGVDYSHSTANPEVNGVELKKQDYVMFSGGVVWRF